MSDSWNRYTGIDPRVVRVIRNKARRLARRSELDGCEVEDLEQEFALHLLRRLPKFDPTRSQLQTFTSRILDRKAASILEARRAGIRDWRCESHSLNEVVSDWDGEATERGDLVDADGCHLRLGLASRPESELRDLALDLLRAVASLPPELRELCIPLLADRVAEVSRSTGIPRGTIYGRLAKIRSRFEDVGLRDYL